MNFAIFRVGKKFKCMNDIKGFERHMERKQNTPNANVEIKNEILIGSSNIIDDVKKYIKDVKLRSNNVIARDLLLTTSPQWMQQATEELKQQWIKANLDWLKKEFGTNIVYCVAHYDETTVHLHILLIPRHFNSKKNTYTLSNRNYFNGKNALSEWQDKYSEAMKEFNLNRGLKWSKARHTDIKTFYRLVNTDINENDLQSLCVKAKNTELLNIKIKRFRDTLRVYRGYNQKTEQEKQEIRKQNIVLYREVEELHKDKNLYKECIRTLSEAYQIPQIHVEKILKYVEKKLEPENNKCLELNK